MESSKKVSIVVVLFAEWPFSQLESFSALSFPATFSFRVFPDCLLFCPQATFFIWPAFPTNLSSLGLGGHRLGSQAALSFCPNHGPECLRASDITFEPQILYL